MALPQPRRRHAPAEPVLRKFNNIECRDAVLAHDGPLEVVTWQRAAAAPDAIPGLPPELARDPARLRAEAERHPLAPVTLWDRRSYKADFATGRDVPDETKCVPLYRYANPRPAEWPACDYVIGNPPFLGKGKLRDDLGDGYVETLRACYPEVPESADFVMYWWHKAATAVLDGKVRRFGLITTNSIRQTFNRRVVQLALARGLSLRFAIPDHPWIDTADGAAVRIAMTVGALAYVLPPDSVVEEPPPPDPSALAGDLFLVRAERATDEEGAVAVELQRLRGRISSSLTIGAELGNVVALKANDLLTTTGLILGSRGFVLSAEEAKTLCAKDPGAKNLLCPLRNGEDLTDKPRDAWVIDTDGWTEEMLRRDCPHVYEHLVKSVKPERMMNRDPRLRKYWWLFRRSNEQVRSAIRGLRRCIVTVETAKHRVFQFIDAAIKPEHRLVVTGSEDAFHLGILSTRIHVVFALASGGTLEDRPVYNKTRCFDPFPFPDCSEAQKEKIRALAEELDAQRKRAQERHGLGLTAIYNVLEKLRANAPLTAAERQIHDQALVATLRHLHDRIDAAVAEAYGWPWPLTDEEILTRVVTLNAARAAEEARGTIRWLRPEFQAPGQNPLALTPATAASSARPKAPAPKKSRRKTPWPAERAAQVEAVVATLTAAARPLAARELAATFARGDARAVAEILSALVTLGRIHRGETRGTYVA
jgi:hypothetical protein